MNLVIFVLALIALPQAAEGFGRHDRCWPSNVTKARCFANVSASAVPWPTEIDDSYTSNNQEVIDLESYSVTSVEKNPAVFCQFKDQLVNAMGCLSEDVAAKCPYLPEEMLMKRERLQKAFDTFCSKEKRIDPLCMRKHWEATMQCHKSLSGDKRQKRPRPTTTSFPEPESDHEDHSHEQPKPKPKPTFDRKQWNKMVCRMKYAMMQCVNKAMESCHEETAQIMNQFMQDMCSTNCTSMMETWDAQGQQGDCPGPYCVAGATTLSLAWATVLSSAFALLLYNRVWFE